MNERGPSYEQSREHKLAIDVLDRAVRALEDPDSKSVSLMSIMLELPVYEDDHELDDVMWKSGSYHIEQVYKGALRHAPETATPPKLMDGNYSVLLKHDAVSGVAYYFTHTDVYTSDGGRTRAMSVTVQDDEVRMSYFVGVDCYGHITTNHTINVSRDEALTTVLCEADNDEMDVISYVCKGVLDEENLEFALGWLRDKALSLGVDADEAERFMERMRRRHDTEKEMRRLGIDGTATRMGEQDLEELIAFLDEITVETDE